MIRHSLKVGLMAFILAGLPVGRAAQAAPETLVLSPGDMLAQIHSRSLMMIFTSTYRQLSGVLDFDPATRTCHIDVQFVVRSLTSPNALMRAQTMSKTFLDPEDFPAARYVGSCQGPLLVGSLTLRGQTHPFTMTLTYLGTASELVAIHAEGILNRDEWGLTGLAFVVGKNIRITNDIALNGEPPVPWHSGS
jgi:polyisoprenoid-binding protein YceI